MLSDKQYIRPNLQKKYGRYTYLQRSHKLSNYFIIYIKNLIYFKLSNINITKQTKGGERPIE